MKALLLNKTAPIESSPLEITDLPIPNIAEDEILIRVKACGICHTDLHIIEGELIPIKLPLIPGHQVVGVVDKIGKSVKTFQSGDRVGIPWLYETCESRQNVGGNPEAFRDGKCEYCLKGQENLCNNARFTGYHTNGGYAEYMVSKEGFIYHLPKQYSDESVAPLLCAGVIGWRSFRLSQTELTMPTPFKKVNNFPLDTSFNKVDKSPLNPPLIRGAGGIKGNNLGIYGFGASAHLVIQIARYYGCRVFVFTRTNAHQELAMSLGAEWTGSPEASPPEQMDSAIIFAPAGNLVPLALKSLKKGGRLILAGIHMSPIPQMPYQLLYEEREIKSVANSTRLDVKDFLKASEEIPLKTTTQSFPLSQANQALQLLKNGKINGAGVLKII